MAIRAMFNMLCVRIAAARNLVKRAQTGHSWCSKKERLWNNLCAIPRTATKREHRLTGFM